MKNCLVIVPVPADFAENPAAVFSAIGDRNALTSCLAAAIQAAPAGATAKVAVATSLASRVHDALTTAGLDDVQVVSAGRRATRAHCIKAAVAGNERDAIILHDLRYPLAPARLFARVLTALDDASTDVVVPARVMVDSVKEVSAAGSIVATVDRTALRTTQFPRGFQAGCLPKLIDENADVFDELASALRLGLSIALVDGDPDAFPVRIPQDLTLASALVSCRLQEKS